MTKFEHHAFVIGLGFVAGFVDVFGFTRLGGLLPAHITGNLIFLAIYLSHGHYQVLMFVAALPIFCVGVVASAWMIGYLAEHNRDPFLPALLMEAGLMLCGMLCLILLPKGHNLNSLADLTTGTFVLLAMAMQNTLMRLVLNNLPPTTVMTGNLTQVLSDTVAYVCRFPSISHTKGERVILERQAKRMLLTILGFAGGALAAALIAARIGSLGLGLPVLVLLGLVPFGHRSLHVRNASGPVV
jgi:uncharacterized membrane protein YoaK (UPF0700 family)